MGYITELTAINEMLVAASERPVTSLENPEADTEVAVIILNQCRREYLLLGRAGNVFIREFTPDPVNGSVLLPDELLNVSINEQPYSDHDIGVVTRTENTEVYLYNVTDDTDDFSDIPTDTLTLNIILDLSWDNIPTALQTEILSVAKQRYQMIVMGDPSINQQLIGEMNMAMRIGSAWNTGTKNRSIFDIEINPLTRLLGRSPLTWGQPNQRRWRSINE